MRIAPILTNSQEHRARNAHMHTYTAPGQVAAAPTSTLPVGPSFGLRTLPNNDKECPNQSPLLPMEKLVLEP